MFPQFGDRLKNLFDKGKKLVTTTPVLGPVNQLAAKALTSAPVQNFAKGLYSSVSNTMNPLVQGITTLDPYSRNMRTQADAQLLKARQMTTTGIARNPTQGLMRLSAQQNQMPSFQSQYASTLPTNRQVIGSGVKTLGMALSGGLGAGGLGTTLGFTAPFAAHESRKTGANFSETLGRQFGDVLPYAGVASKISAPFISKFAPTGVLANRVGQGTLNAVESVGLDLATGNKVSAGNTALAFALGVAGKPFAGSPAKSNFRMDQKTLDELVEAEQMIRLPNEYVGKIPTGARTAKEAEKIIRERGKEIIDRIAGKHLPNKQLETIKNPLSIAKVLFDLNRENKLANIPVAGITDNKKSAQAGLYDTVPANQKALLDEATKRGFKDKNPNANVWDVREELQAERDSFQKVASSLMKKYDDLVKSKKIDPGKKSYFEMMSPSDKKLYQDTLAKSDRASEILKTEYAKPNVAQQPIGDVKRNVITGPDNNGFMSKDIQFTATPLKSSLDELIPFARKKELNPSESDAFYGLVNKGEFSRSEYQFNGASRGKIGFIDEGKVKSAYADFAKSKNIPQQQPLSTPTKGVQTMQSVGEVLGQGKKLTGLKSASEVQRTPPELLQAPQTVRKMPGQLKQTSDDIIANAKKEIGEAPKEKPETLRQSFDRFYTQWVDRFHPVVKASDIAEKTGKLKTESNPKYLVRRLTGATGIADARVRRELDPIIKEAESLKIDKTDLDVYLKARREAGFGEVGRDIKGSDPVVAGQRIQALEERYGPQIKEVADKLYEYQNKGFQEMIDAGFISPEAGATIRSQNPDYVPFDRVMDELDSYLGLPTRKLMQGSQPIQKIKGSERQIYSPLENIMTNTFKQRAAIEKNRVAKSIVDLQKIAPELGFKKVGNEGYNTITTAEGEFRKVLKPNNFLPEDTIIVWNNGKKEAWYVGKDIAETAKGLNEENTNTLLKLFTGPASLLRQGATGRNPEFMIPNIVRDQIDAAVASKYGYIPFIDYLSGLKSVLTEDEIYRKWEASGAKIDLGSMSGRKTVEEATKRRSLFTPISKALDWLGEFSEQPTRVGLFKKAYKATGDELKALMESRDATVDFARMGSKMKVANSIVPFLNVGVQGFDKLIRAVKNQPGKVALNATIYGVLPTVVTTLYNLANHAQEYAEIPQYEKDSNFVIVKGRNQNGTVDYITIPKGNILPIISNPAQSFIEYIHGQSQQTFSEFVTQFLSSSLPVVGDGQSLQEVGIKTIGGNLPQLIKPVTENLLNKSFYKYDTKKEQTKEIVPYYLQKEEPYKQAYKFTPELYKKIGQVLNVSPLKVQNLLEGYLAGYVKLPANVIDMIYRGADTNKTPILRRFIKETYPTSGKKTTETKTSGLAERISGNAKAAEVPSEKITYKVGEKEKELDLKWIATRPDITNDSPINKETISRYKADISREINKTYDAYKAGAITETQATDRIKELQARYDEMLKKPGRKKTGGVSKKKTASVYKELAKLNKPFSFKLKASRARSKGRRVTPRIKAARLPEFSYKGKPFTLKKNKLSTINL